MAWFEDQKLRQERWQKMGVRLEFVDSNNPIAIRSKEIAAKLRSSDSDGGSGKNN